MREEGYLEELKKKWWYEKSQCTDPNSEMPAADVINLLFISILLNSILIVFLVNI